ncbi:MAG: FG-GAP-like repeat-containing protein [Kiritimatiellae bacterium]|nr:FG-GAP-like repeat-containing protein [Kiritimatiellia bacterium]
MSPSEPSLRSILGWCAAIFLGVPAHGFAAIVDFNQTSDPLGIVSQSTTVSTPGDVLTVVAPLESSGYRFTHWTLNGVHTNDFTGRALNPARFTIYEPTEAVAHYVLSANDVDLDVVPDWYEIHFYGDTNQPADSDTDGDGIDLLAEYAFDYHPRLSNTVVAGGVGQRSSDQTLIVLNPALYVYEERSEPRGLVSRRLVVSNGTSVVSQNLAGEAYGHSFAYWTVNGARQQDSYGIALSRFTAVVTGTTVAVAYYYPTANDLDANGIPDWYEWKYLGSVSNSPSSDVDSDGLTLAQEHQLDYSPRLSNTVVSGGIAQRNSEVVPVKLSGFGHYTIHSDPLGLISSVDDYAPTGTVVTTQNLHGEAFGYAFGFWAIEGIRQADEHGIALSRVSFSVTGTMEVVAQYFLRTNDLDGDGVEDWYEWQNYGTLAQAAGSDTDGDGVTLLQEFSLDYPPAISNCVVAGGIAQRNSGLVGINLQPFERMEYVQVDGVLTRFFTVWPTNEEASGMDFGANTAPGAGDWNGDGNYDLFVGASGGVVRVYENIGSEYTLNFTERNDAFTGLSAAWGDIPHPYPSLGDWNGDGRDDLAVGGDAGRIRIVASPGNFTDPQSPAVSYDLALADSVTALPAFAEVTGDSNLDLLVMVDDGSVRVYANSGNHSLPFGGAPVETNQLGSTVVAGSGLSMRDINGDDVFDALASDRDGRIWEYYRNASSNFVLQSKVWGGAGKGFANRLTIGAADLDGDGDTDAYAGYDYGGLMFLRDPRIGPPAGLRAFDGPDSILLQWEPDRQTRVRGYYVYRGSSATGAFARLMDAPVSMPEYRDSAAPAGVTSFYYVTAVSAAYLPGNTMPRLVESPPSDIVSAATRSLVLWMPDYSGRRGDWAVLQVNVENADGLSGNGLDLRISYDPAVIIPAAQVNATNATVEKTPLSESFTLVDNGESAAGALQITGSGGTVVAGEGRLLNVVFWVSTGAVLGAKTTNTIVLAILQDSGGQPMAVDHSDVSVLTVATAYFLGDVNGDGVLDMDDHHRLMELLKKNSPPPTPEELYAGDLNGNGRLDHGDIPLLNRLIHGLSIYPGK